MPRAEQQRSCISCRTAKAKGELLRFVLAPDSTLVPDLQHKLPGRGAYTCLQLECIKKAADRKQFSRAFKAEARHGIGTEVVSQLKALVEGRLASYIALANKAGEIISGTDMVIEALHKGKAGLVVLATDISADIGRKVAGASARFGIQCKYLLDKERLGSLLGKELRSAAAIEKGGFAETVSRECHKYRNFLEEGAQINE